MNPENNLSRREGQVLELALKGLKSREIGIELGISLGTVKVHLANVYRKFGVNTKAQLLIKILSTYQVKFSAPPKPQVDSSLLPIGSSKW
jgi:DNA-binding CsgD family transcriptional regulator